MSRKANAASAQDVPSPIVLPLAHLVELYACADQFVKPSTEAFVLPTKSYADVVVPRGAENTVAIELISNHINRWLCDLANAASHAQHSHH